MNVRPLAALIVLGFLVGAAVVVRMRGADAPVSEAPVSDEPVFDERVFDERGADGVAPAHGGATTGATDLVGRLVPEVPDDGVRTVERTLDLGGTLAVRVVDAVGKRPVAGAKVRGTFGLGWGDDRPTGLTFDQEVVSGADGVARFGQFPRQTSVVIHVACEGFRVARVDARLERFEGEKELEVALKPGLAPAASSVVVGLPAGVSLPGASVLYEDATSKSRDRLPIGGYVPIDDDPAATVVEHDVAIQLILPGYAGPVRRRALRRGTTLALDPPGPTVSQAIVLLDELGRGIEGVDVTVWPLEALVFRARGSAARGTTDTEGVCRLDGWAGTRWDLALDETRVHATERLYETPVAVGSGPRTIRCARRAIERFRLDVPGIATPKGACALDWTSFEPVPDSPVDRRFRTDESRRAEAIERYRASLPKEVAWARDASGAPGFALALVPGTYVLVPAVAGVVGRETTISVPVGGGEVVVAFAATRKVTVQVTGSIDRADGLLPFGAIVAPRRVGWDERVGLTNQIDRTWAAILARPPRRTDDDLRDFAHFSGRAIATARGRDPVIGADVVWSGFDGITEVDVADEPRELTVMFPGHRAAVVPLEPGSPHRRAHVEPSMFRTLDVRVRRAGEGPAAGYAVALDAVARLRRGRGDLWGTAKADAVGVLRVGYLPGETLGLFRGNDGWTVTPSGGTTAERIDVGDATSYLVTTPPSGTPSLELVVEPYVARK